MLTTELERAGAETIVQTLALGLRRLGHDVAVASLVSRTADDGSVARDLRAAGIAVHPLRARGRRDWRVALRYRALLRRIEPTVVNAHGYHAQLLARLIRHSSVARVVGTVHTERSHRGRSVLEFVTRGLEAHTICVSRAVEDAVLRRGAANRSSVVMNGIDDDLDRRLFDREVVRRRLGVAPDDLVVGTIARLVAEKGIDRLIDAAAAIHDPRIRFAIVGEGPDRFRLEESARAAGLCDRLLFLGAIDDAWRYLLGFDVYCQPSREEGFGLALLEAMRAGLPCVASNVGGLPEVLGDAGILLPSFSDGTLAAVLINLLNDEPLRISQGIRARDRSEYFTAKRMLSQTVPVLFGSL